MQFFLVLSFGCQKINLDNEYESKILNSVTTDKELNQQEDTTQENVDTDINESKTEETYNTLLPYETEFEGLHLTGTPIDVDIKTYRLKIGSAVDKELSLTFDDVKRMESVREVIELVCPGFFVDLGSWTGVRVIDLLNLAGIKKEAKDVEFISIHGSYVQTLPIEKVKGDGFLIVYQFNDKEFSRYHGYPLRLVAKGEAGSYWVKWLEK